MRAVIVYESMFGNTHAVAEHIGEGVRTACDDVAVVPIAEATADLVGGADLVIIGGPTHVHGMSSSRTRAAAREGAAKDGADVDPSAVGPGLRDWLENIGPSTGQAAAAFDTRVKGWALATGRASVAIDRRLHRHGYRPFADPMSFLVDRHNHLLPDEAGRATDWGALLVQKVLAAQPRRAHSA